MRIIAGQWRSRRLEPPADPRVRPTTDRVREAWMNIVADRLTGATVVDLFAGTGAMGLEALSRGAARCDFVELDQRSLAALGRNIETLGAAEPRDFAHQRGGQVGEVEGRGQEHGLDIGRQLPVHQRHLVLVFEVAHVAQAANDESRADLAREVHQQPLERLHLEARIAAQAFPGEGDALLQGEQGCLPARRRHPDDDPVRKRQSTLDEVLVAARDRIKGPRIDRNLHGASRKVMTVVP